MRRDMMVYRKCLMKRRDGQQVLEFILMATAVVAVLIVFLFSNRSPMQTSVNNVLKMPYALIKAKTAEIRF
jgi:hypothetical protein